MTLHDGLLLLGGVIVLYLYDSALLLYHNEIILIGTCAGYRVSGGSGFELGGRHVFLPQPLFSHQPLFRVNWPDRGVLADAQAIRLRRVRVALMTMAPWNTLLLVLFAVGMPYVVFVSGQLDLLLAWLLIVYLVIAVTLALVWRYRKALNLSMRDVAAVSLDALLCAPFALNLIRKIGLRQRFAADLRVLAKDMLSDAAIDDLTVILRQRIHLSLRFAEPGDATSVALGSYLDDFEALRK